MLPLGFLFMFIHSANVDWMTSHLLWPPKNATAFSDTLALLNITGQWDPCFNSISNSSQL